MNPLEQLTGADVLWAPVVLGFVEALKKAGWSGDAKLVFTTLLLGPLLVTGWWAKDGAYTLAGGVEALYTGLFASLIAMGVFKGVKLAAQRLLGNGADFQPRGER